MKLRFITAIIGIAILIPFVVVGGAWFAYGMLFLAAIGLFELARMQKISYFNEVGLISTLALASVVLPQHYLDGFLNEWNPHSIFYIAGMALLILTVYRSQQFNFVDAATLIFGALYLGFGFRYLIQIRDLGLQTMIYVFLVIWSTDTGAYFVGKRCGKRPLAPQISPKKTIEGAIGGVLTAVVVTILYSAIVPIQVKHGQYLPLLTILISIAGQFGDLVESSYKRYFQVKDSGNLFPGHGGVLDRFDSTIFASIMFIVWHHFKVF